MVKTWTDEQLIHAVSISKTFAEVARCIGLKCYGANAKTLKKHMARLNLSTAHFLSKQEQIKIARGLIHNKSHEEILSLNSVDRKYIKKFILKHGLLEYKCNQCGIYEWQGQRLSLHLDHKNGVNNDNRLENLRFLCPNCHSLTDTYCGKSLKNIYKSEKPKCQECGNIIARTSKRCKSCATKRQKTKIIWPDIIQLRLLVSELGYTGAAKTLGVSDNSVKKHIKNNS